MDQIAFIIGEVTIYWSSLILALSVFSGICFFWSLWMWKKYDLIGAAAYVPLALVLSVAISRFVHWYCRADSYSGFGSAMSDYSTGGYALLGVFVGCLLAAVILRLLKIVDSLPKTLDCVAVAGCASIATGRLGSLFSSMDRGQILANTVKLPWAYPVINAVSGVTEYRLATFMLQAMASGIIFFVLAFLFLREKNNRELRDGDAALLFMLLYGASQVVLDSTRYDSLYLRSNGFVSAVQIAGAIGVVTAIVDFSVRAVKANGWKGWYTGAWVAIAALLGGAGYMEYYVQRHGNQAAFAYRNMSLCLLAAIGLTIALWIQAIRKERATRLPTIYDIDV